VQPNTPPCRLPWRCPLLLLDWRAGGNKVQPWSLRSGWCRRPVFLFQALLLSFLWFCGVSMLLVAAPATPTEFGHGDHRRRTWPDLLGGLHDNYLGPLRWLLLLLPLLQLLGR